MLTLNPKRPISVSLLRVLCAICGVLDFLAHAGDKVEPASAFLVWAKSAWPPLRVKKFLRNTL